jgi:peroxiredoxin
MNLSILPPNLPIPKNDGGCEHLLHQSIPEISLLNQDGNYLKLNRNDTFRVVLYCYSMTGHPDKPLPPNWDSIPGARGCTPETCSFRNHYDAIIKLNAIPIGMSTQAPNDLKEMTKRLMIPYDIVSDTDLKFSNKMNLPTFSINKVTYIKRLTLIIERSVIKKIFYPIFPPDLHIIDVLDWLQNN